jgi:hypothetical protein
MYEIYEMYVNGSRTWNVNVAPNLRESGVGVGVADLAVFQLLTSTSHFTDHVNLLGFAHLLKSCTGTGNCRESSSKEGIARLAQRALPRRGRVNESTLDHRHNDQRQ